MKLVWASVYTSALLISKIFEKNDVKNVQIASNFLFFGSKIEFFRTGSGPHAGLPSTTKLGSNIPPPPASAPVYCFNSIIESKIFIKFGATSIKFDRNFGFYHHNRSNQWNWCHENSDFSPVGWVKDPTSETWFENIFYQISSFLSLV